MGADLDDVPELVEDINELRRGMEEAHRAKMGVDESEYTDHYTALELVSLVLENVKMDIEDGHGDTELISDVAQIKREREAEATPDHSPDRNYKHE